jgi:IS30 family transposase
MLVHENRGTRFLLITRLKGKDAESVRKVSAMAMKQLPESLSLSLTYDRGKEMAEHKKFTMDTNVYF